MKLSREQLSVIAARGSFLSERLQGTYCFNPASSVEVECRERYQLWKTKAGGNCGEPTFLKRLKLDGITREKALEMMADPAWDPEIPFPEWVADLQAICELFPFNGDGLQIGLSFEEETGIRSKYDMIDALSPFVYFASRRLSQKLDSGAGLFTQNAFADLNVSLVKALQKLCFQTFNECFRLFVKADNPLVTFMGTAILRDEREKYWREFTSIALAGGWKEIMLEYPVLARLVTITINQWVDNITELARFLATDAPKLEKLFFGGQAIGAIIKVQTDLSDPHNNGKSVYILEFGGGRKVVFKPHSLKIDQIWTELLDWVNQKGSPIPLMTPRAIDLGDHGWMEWVQNDPLKDQAAARRFYFCAGIIVGLVNALGGEDFHRENLIAWGEYPVLIDTETLLQHQVKSFQPDTELKAEQIAADFLSASILRTGFFPSRTTVAPGEPPVDSGSLTGKKDGCGNLPVLNGSCLTAIAYREQLLEGFRWIYDCMIKYRSELLGPKSPLQEFTSCQFRFIIRASRIYGDMLRHTAMPDFLKDGLLYSMEIERLAAVYLHSAPDKILTEVWRIFQSESEALHRRDYPIFYGEADALRLMDAKTVLYDGYFEKSAIDVAKEIIGKLDQDDQRTQLDLIENVLEICNLEVHDEIAATFQPSPGLETNGQLDNTRLIAEAYRIYEEMMAERITGQDGDATWIVQQYDLTTRKLTLGKISLSLYDGIMGLALFMAALYRLTGDKMIKENALKCIQPFRVADHDSSEPFPFHRFPLGLGNGLGGLVIAMMGLALYLDEPILADNVRHLLHHLPSARIADDSQYDVLCGSAGLVLALAKFDFLTKDERIRELVRSCGEQLISGRVKTVNGHRVWRSNIENEPQAGMSHGATGIACALLKVYELTGNHEYYEAAMEAIDFETMLYDSNESNWPVHINPRQKVGSKAFMSGWCGGAPGIGLGRLANLHMERTPAILADIENAIVFTLKHSMNSSYHLCCGNSGRIDLLIEAALKLGRPGLLQEARDRAGWMVSRKEHRGHYTFNAPSGKVFNPSLFQGTAGIGYELLRCVSPEIIFSVLI